MDRREGEEMVRTDEASQSEKRKPLKMFGWVRLTEFVVEKGS